MVIMKSQAADCCHVVAFPVGSVLIVPGEPEIGHQHPVLEDRRSPDGLQSAEACFSEKYSNRRWGSIFLPFCVTPSFSPFSRFCLASGVAYTSECFPCKPGTFSSVPGSSACLPCPRDTYSGHGASSCTPCDTATQYAGESH